MQPCKMYSLVILLQLNLQTTDATNQDQLPNQLKSTNQNQSTIKTYRFTIAGKSIPSPSSSPYVERGGRMGIRRSGSGDRITGGWTI